MNPESDELIEVIEVKETENEDHTHHKEENEQNEDPLTSTDQLVYDRQIRLWGIQAQKKIMNSKVLFLGKNGIQEECMKNLLLAGMKVTLANDHLVSEKDVKLSFFLKTEDIGKPHAVSLCKRMASITLNVDRISGLDCNCLVEEDGLLKFKDIDLLKTFNVLCVSTRDYPLHKLEWLNEECRSLGIGFFASMSCGNYGYFFTDLNQHKVLETFNKKSDSVTIEYRSLSSVLKEPQFPRNCEPALRSLMGLIFLFQENDDKQISEENFESAVLKTKGDRKILRKMVDMKGTDLPVTSSIMGGYLALEVRKFVTRQHETIPNFCLFDMANSSVSTAMI